MPLAPAREGVCRHEYSFPKSARLVLLRVVKPRVTPCSDNYTHGRLVSGRPMDGRKEGGKERWRKEGVHGGTKEVVCMKGRKEYVKKGRSLGMNE